MFSGDEEVSTVRTVSEYKLELIQTVAESNSNLRDALQASKTPIYPVRMAAERAWDAAHGDQIHYMVGKEAERARFAARFMPNAMRAQFKKFLKD